MKDHQWMKWDEVEGVMTSRRMHASDAAVSQSQSNSNDDRRSGDNCQVATC